MRSTMCLAVYEPDRDSVVVDLLGDDAALGLRCDVCYRVCPAIDEAITTMKEDGTMAEIHEKWFGSAAPANSSTVTVFAIP